MIKCDLKFHPSKIQVVQELTRTSRPSMEVLKEMFPGCLISIQGGVPWPARSPDLAPYDFFILRHLKAKVFTEKTRIIQELKVVI